MSVVTNTLALNASPAKSRNSGDSHKMHSAASMQIQTAKSNQVGTVVLYGVPIVSLIIENQDRLCLAQISNTLLKDFSYNEIHNRRVALGITCVQCTPVQLEILRRAGAMPVSSRRCGMITRREAERLCKSFLGDNSPPRLPEDFAFSVHHECAWGCRGAFLPSRYNSSRAKCIKCTVCGLFFSPNKFIFHSHRTGPNAKYVQPDAANFNSWRRHMKLSGSPPDEVTHAWEDVKAMFNGGTRKRLLQSATSSHRRSPHVKAPRRIDPPSTPPPPAYQMSAPPPTRVPPLPLVMDYVWHHGTIKHPFSPYTTLPWLGLPSASPLLIPPADGKIYPSAFRPVYSIPRPRDQSDDEETVDIETCPEDDVKPCWTPPHSVQQKSRDAETSPTREPPPTVLCTDESERCKPDTPPREEAEPRLWTVTRLPKEWPDRSIYRQQVARQLHLMRELVGPNAGNEAATPVPPFMSVSHMSQNTDQQHQQQRRNRDKVLQCPVGSTAVDCTACHQIAGAYTDVMLPMTQHSATNTTVSITQPESAAN